MRRYHGGQLVKRGVYLNLSSFELNHLYELPAILPSHVEVDYVKLPAFLALLTGPFAGLALIIFLPLVGILSVCYMLVYKAGRGVALLVRKTG